jgi:GH25 family lysozyme M1 (1,4-beta-N-acetylmuramidase)
MLRTAVAGGVVVAVSLASVPDAIAAEALWAHRPVRGLDISAYQHVGRPINWRLLARQGIRFVAIKVSEGTYYRNPYYRSDARAASAAGLAVMPYVFANPSQAGGARTARFAFAATGLRRRHAALPFVVDLENDPYGRGDCYGLSVHAMLTWIGHFNGEAGRLTGKRPVIYTTAAWWRECTRSTRLFAKDPLWLAAFAVTRPTTPSPWRHWAFWQYNSDGFLPGVGHTDLDYYEPTAALPALHPAKPKHKHKPKKHKHKPKPKHEPKKHKHKPKKHGPKKHGPKKHGPKKHGPKPKHRPKPKRKHRPKHRPKPKRKHRPKHRHKRKPKKHKPKKHKPRPKKLKRKVKPKRRKKPEKKKVKKNKKPGIHAKPKKKPKRRVKRPKGHLRKHHPRKRPVKRHHRKKR